MGLSLAVSGAFLVAAPAAEAVPGVSGVQVIPSYFSPDGDALNDTATIAFTPEGATTNVTVDLTVTRVSDDTLMATLLAAASLPAGAPTESVWSPGVIADGRYRFTIIVTEGALSDTATADVEADSTPPVLSFGLVGPSPFDPDVAPLGAEVQVDTDVSTVTTVTVELDGTTLATLGTAMGPDTVSFVWDGTVDADSSEAPDGAYDVVAVAADAANNSGSDTPVVILDRGSPIFLPDDADTIMTDTYPVTVTGRITDGHLVASLELSSDGGPFVPQAIGSPTDTLLYSVVIPDAAPVPGYRDFTLRASDVFGHQTSFAFVIAYDMLFPAVTGTTLLDSDGVVADGDSVLIRTVWNQAGLNLTANFGFLDREYLAGDESVLDEGNGSYLIRYRTNPSNSQDPGPWPVPIKASTGFIAAGDTLLVTLRDAQGDALVSVNRNRFDPLAGEEVRVAAEGIESFLAVDIYNLSGRRVRELEGSGFVDWDGTNDDGSIVSSGVYLLRVKVDEGEEIRRVAVVRGGSR